MDFWTYCEKVSMCVGQFLVMRNCRRVYDFWYHNYAVGEVAAYLQKHCVNSVSDEHPCD